MKKNITLSFTSAHDFNHGCLSILSNNNDIFV